MGVRELGTGNRGKEGPGIYSYTYSYTLISCVPYSEGRIPLCAGEICVYEYV